VAALRRHFLVLLSLSLGACATKFYEHRKKIAIYDWYRDHRTASGERFNVHALAAAHRSLPFGSKVRVIDLKTEKSVIVRINDRGPYIRGRIIDLTIGAARELGIYHRGIAQVRVEHLREIPILEKPNLRTKERKKTNPFAILSTNR
jgi:rare lipoprotein A